MLIPFFYLLRDGGMKPSITELLTLLEAMKKGVAGQSVDDFYYLSRACLVKDESKLDLFDRIFAAFGEVPACGPEVRSIRPSAQLQNDGTVAER